MIVYRISGEGLLRLASMAAASPTADVDVILGVIHGADIEEGEPEPEMELPDVSDRPAIGGGDNNAILATKPAKPE